MSHCFQFKLQMFLNVPKCILVYILHFIKHSQKQLVPNTIPEIMYLSTSSHLPILFEEEKEKKHLMV